MRRKLEGIAAILLCLLLWLLCGPAKAGSYAVAVVSNPNPADRLNLRAEPKDGAASLGLYYTGVRVVVKTVGNTWWQVEIGSRKGWMQAKYLVPCGEQGDVDQTVLNSVGSAIPTAVVGNQRPQDGLHLRHQPSTTAGSDFKFYNGTPVEIWGIVDGGDWYHVYVPEIDATGFMLAKYVIPDVPIRPVGGGSTQPSGGGLTGAFAVVNNPLVSDRLNLRAGTSDTTRSLGMYYNGTTVEVLSDNGTWCQVAVDNQTGYMQSKYLLKDSAIKPPMTPNAGRVPDLKETLRAAPWASAKAVQVPGTRGYNQPITILGRAGTWYYVGLNGVNGYFPANAVEPGANPPVGHMAWAVVSCPNLRDRLNLRTQPDQDANARGQYFSGTVVEVLDYNPTGASAVGQMWYKVRVGSQTGYMQASFLEDVRAGDPADW